MGDNMKKYLIALDLDGTLLQDWQTLNEETSEYIKELKKDGHQFVIATGRPFRSSEKYYNILELDTPIVNYNGGLVTSKKDPKFRNYSYTLDLKCVLNIFEDNKQYIYNAFGEIGDDIYLLHDTEEIRPLIHFFNGARLFVGDFKDTLPSNTNGFIIIANKGEGHFIEEYIKENFAGKLLSRNWGNEYRYIIEIFTPETNKGTALKYVSEYLGYEPEEIIAFGDGHNDIEMLEFAGLGVAMKNANKDLLKVADVVLEHTNVENGIMKFLKEYLK